MSGKSFTVVRKYRALLVCVAAVMLLWQVPVSPIEAAQLAPRISLQNSMPIKLTMPEAGETCSYCGAPPVDDATGFVVTSLFEDGNYVAVWLSKQDGRVHARCLAPNGRKTGADILIPADTDQGLLPTPVTESDGKFRLVWVQDGKARTGRFDCNGEVLGMEASNW